MKDTHYVYILVSTRNGRYYIGYSQDVELRLQQHNSGKVKSTRHMRPWAVVYTEACESATSARQREHYLKRQKSRRFIEQLISTRGPVAQTVRAQS